ncbi:MAG: hypothetical protein JW941_12335, partial [Candidatus Coatesbacteria bacterium]|nr:hypothetical protein [Candidatus Coatesbacteria bacterium]
IAALIRARPWVAPCGSVGYRGRQSALVSYSARQSLAIGVRRKFFYDGSWSVGLAFGLHLRLLM